MDNVIAPWSMEGLKTGRIAQAMPADRMLQQVSVRNIGDVVASRINRRESVFGERFDFAGDELSGEESAEILTRITGRKVSYETLPISVVKEQSDDMAAMFAWFDRLGYNVNLPELHQLFSDVKWQSYPQWVEAQDWGFLKEAE